MVAGIILTALGLKKTLGDVDAELETVPAFALLGGVALYLIGLVAFRFRHVKTVNWRRLGLAVVLVALVPAATELPALATLAIATTLLWILIAIETSGYGEDRTRVRHGDAFPAAR
jgi:low temperature requirement protein LtrA